MKRQLLNMVGCLFFCSAVFIPKETLAQSDNADQKNGQDSIEQTISKFSDAWNMHDAKAFAMLFADDADFTNVFGQSAKGRLAIEKFHAPIFSTIFKLSKLIIEDKKVRFIKPDVAAVDIRWTMIGATFPDGKPWPDRKGLLSGLMIPQKNGQWVIVVMHNMDLPEIPSK